MSAEQTTMIDDLDTFVRVLVHWHQNKVSVLNHMMKIPEGTTVTDSEAPNEPPLVLEGPAMQGFVLGLKTALHELGTLPFEAELEIVPDDDAAPAQANGHAQAELELEAPAPVTH